MGTSRPLRLAVRSGADSKNISNTLKKTEDKKVASWTEGQCTGWRTKINWTKTAHRTPGYTPRPCIDIYTSLCDYGLSTGPGTNGLSLWWICLVSRK